MTAGLLLAVDGLPAVALVVLLDLALLTSTLALRPPDLEAPPSPSGEPPLP